MKCPNPGQWHLVASEALTGPAADALLDHARTCPTCQAQFEAARREHVQRIRMYESLDREHDRLREQLLAALPAGQPRCSGIDRFVRGAARLGDFVMRLNQTTGRRAAALLVPLAAAAAVAFFLLAPGTQKSAFAAALEHLKRIHSLTCRVSTPEGFEIQGVKLNMEGTLEFSDEYGSHSEMKMNGAVITQHYAPVQGPMVLVQPVTSTWMEVDTSQIASLELTEQSPDAFLRGLRALTADTAPEIGRETVATGPVIGYRIPPQKLGLLPSKANTQATDAQLWVDATTKLPVRFVLTLPVGPSGEVLKMAYDDFRWDTPVDPKAFKPNIPADYTKVDARLTRPNEEALLHALDRIQYFTGGTYPSELGPASVLGRFFTTMVAPERKPEFEQLGRAGMVQFGLEVGAGTMYFMQLVRDGREPEFFGGTVTHADADKVLVRWKLESGQVRVIYGDLRAETLPAEK